MYVAPKPIADCPWYLKPFFWNQKRKYGDALISSRVWARSPPLFLGVATLYGMIDRKWSPIEPSLRSLITVLVSQINTCAFCVDLNSALLIKRGVGLDKIDALANWRASDAFSERERAALEFAEAVTRTESRVTPELMARLEAHFDDDAIVELAGLVAFQNLSSKFNSALAIPAQGFCPRPGAGPESDRRARSEVRM